MNELFLKKVIRKILWVKWKVNFFGEMSAPWPASAVYSHGDTQRETGRGTDREEQGEEHTGGV